MARKKGKESNSKEDVEEDSIIEVENASRTNRARSTSRATDPLTYILWGVMMLIYAGFLFLWGYLHPEARYNFLLYLIQPFVFIIFGSYIILHGIKQNQKARLSYLEKKT